MTDAEKKQKILSFIKLHSIAVIATSNSQGKPEDAVLEFSERDNLELIFDTFSTYRKYKNLQTNKNVAFVIGWDNDITVQYEGEAFELQNKERDEYQKIHLRKLPNSAKFVSMEEIRYFKVLPKWIRYSNLAATPWEVFEVNF